MKRHYLCYVHFKDMRTKLVQGIYVHPVPFDSSGAAHRAERDYLASIVPYLNHGTHTSGETTTHFAATVAGAQDMEVRELVRLGYSGLTDIDRVYDAADTTPKAQGNCERVTASGLERECIRLAAFGAANNSPR